MPRAPGHQVRVAVRRDDETGTGVEGAPSGVDGEDGPGAHQGAQVVSDAGQCRDGCQGIGLGLVEGQLHGSHATGHEGLGDSRHGGGRDATPDGDGAALEDDGRDGGSCGHRGPSGCWLTRRAYRL